MKDFILDALGVFCAWFILILFSGEILLLLSVDHFIPDIITYPICCLAFLGLVKMTGEIGEIIYDE